MNSHVFCPYPVGYSGEQKFYHSFRLFRHRPFDEKQYSSTWMAGTENGEEFVYLRCFHCGRVLKTPASDVDPDGFIVPNLSKVVEKLGTRFHYKCLTCGCCNLSNYAYLEGWKEHHDLERAESAPGQDPSPVREP